MSSRGVPTYFRRGPWILDFHRMQCLVTKLRKSEERIKQRVLHEKFYETSMLNEEIPFKKILERDEIYVKVAGYDV